MQPESSEAERLEQRDTLHNLLESWENEIEMSGTSGNAIMKDYYSMMSGDFQETSISNKEALINLFSDNDTEPKPSISENIWENDRLIPTEDLNDEYVTILPNYNKQGSLDDIFGIQTSISSNYQSIRDLDQFYNLMWPRNNHSTLPTVNTRIQRNFDKKLINEPIVVKEKGKRIKAINAKGIKNPVKSTRVPKYLKQYYIYFTVSKKEILVYQCRNCKKSFVELEKGMNHDCNRRKAGRRIKNS